MTFHFFSLNFKLNYLCKSYCVGKGRLKGTKKYCKSEVVESEIMSSLVKRSSPYVRRSHTWLHGAQSGCHGKEKVGVGVNIKKRQARPALSCLGGYLKCSAESTAYADDTSTVSLQQANRHGHTPPMHIFRCDADFNLIIRIYNVALTPPSFARYCYFL